MKPGIHSPGGRRAAGIMVTLLVLLLPLSPQEQAVLGIETRWEGETAGGGRASGRLLVDYADLDGALIASRRKDGSCRISGGLGVPWMKLGTVSLEGPLRELRSPPQAAPLSGVYEAKPSAALERGWSPASRYGLALGLPGRVWLSVTSANEALPEAAAVLEIGERAKLAASAVLLYSRVTAAEKDEWTLPQGMPPEGEILMGGVRLARSGSGGAVSGFAGASLHPLLPAGFYLRGKLACKNHLIDAGGRLGWTNRFYRTPASALPPYLASGGIETRLFPDFPVSLTGSISAELDHPPLDGSAGADWKGAAAAGGEFEGRAASLSLERSLELRSTEGEVLAEEHLKGSVETEVPFASELHLSLKSAFRLADGKADALRLGLRCDGGVLEAELWGGFSSGGEFGERHPERVKASGGRIDFTTDEWSVSLDAAVGKHTEWRLTGGRRFGGTK